MGLDMYAYVAAKAGAQADYDEGMAWDKEKGAMVNPSVTEPREIAYWRKHPNLHGWMQRLWVRKTNERLGPRDKSGWWTDPDRAGEFNGVELELTWDDLEQLEQDIRDKNLPNTTGFFFGNDADDHYREHDLKFVREAKAEAFLGLKVFYNSSW
jgi:hypothetical protein